MGGWAERDTKPTHYPKHAKLLWESCYLLAFLWINIDIGIQLQSLWVRSHNESPINIPKHSAAGNRELQGQSRASAANADAAAPDRKQLQGPVTRPTQPPSTLP